MADSGATRVMVRGLPPYVTKERLREVFGEVGEVTDAKVMKTSSGKSRCFGFVGFKSARHATQALKRFDKTYLDTAKLAVHRKARGRQRFVATVEPLLARLEQAPRQQP